MPLAIRDPATGRMPRPGREGARRGLDAVVLHSERQWLPRDEM